MDEIVAYLTGIPAWYLATVDEKDPAQPRVRPFSFAAADAGKLWFCTSFELSGWKPGTGWIVVSGEADLADDANVSEEVREAGFRHMVGLGEAHESAHDGRLAFFSVRGGVARFCDITGDERRFSF